MNVISIFIAIEYKTNSFSQHVKMIDVALIDKYTCRPRVKSALHVGILPVFDSNVTCTRLRRYVSSLRSLFYEPRPVKLFIVPSIVEYTFRVV